MNDIAKFQELQEKLIEGAKSATLAPVSELRSEFEEFRKKASRFAVAENENSTFGLKEATQLIARSKDLAHAYKHKQSYQVEIGKNPLDLKAVTYNPGNQTVSGDIRQVLAAYQRPGMNLLPVRPPSIRELLTVVPTNAQFINWIEETSYTNAAAPVTQGDDKQESATALIVRRQPMEVLAHVIRVPLQLAEDVPMFENYLEQRLVDMLRVVSEDLYLYGDGTAPNLLGITSFTGIQTYTQTVTENRIDAIRQGLNKLENSWYPWADAILLHPNDVVRMELLKDANDRYLWPTFGRFADGYNSKTLFGVPVISSTCITEGTFLLGNFRQGATLYQRQDVTVDVSFSDRDNFIKNLMTIRCESRECLVPEYPKCFVSGTFLGATYD